MGVDGGALSDRGAAALANPLPAAFLTPVSALTPSRGKGRLATVWMLLLAGLTALPAAAQTAPDPRIRTVFYDPDKVVRIDAVFGYQLMVQFSGDERIENVAIGDGAAWQVTPNKAADLLFIKPVDHAADTNMTVVTDKRSYLFELDAHAAAGGRAGGPTYVLRFTYPPPPAVAVVAPPPAPIPPERKNIAYSYTGSRELLPSIVFDDGKVTYMKWPAETTTPAVFAIAADGQESLVNASWRDGYEVVEQIAPSFRLRDGKAVTTVINDGWRAPDRGGEAPRPHDRKTAREAAKEGVKP
jgi:type IV secretion system protein VirB9